MPPKGNSKNYTLYIDNTEAERALDKLRPKAAALEEKIKDIQKAGGNAAKEMQKLANTQAQIKSLENAIANGLTKSLRDYQNEVVKAKRLMDRATDPTAAKQLKAGWEAAKKALLEYEANVLKVDRAQKQLKKETQGIGGQLKDFILGSVIGGGIIGVLTTVASKVRDIFNASIEGAEEAEAVVAEFERTLEKIGRIEAASRLEGFAERIKEQLSFLDDEDILKIFEKLIDFGQLTEQQIRQLTPVIIDFAAKERIDLAAAAEQIAKALAGQGKALKDYGIHISEAGTVTDRFNILMTELKSKVDGAAAAFGETNRGEIAKTRQAIDDLQEDIGGKLLPVYAKLLSFTSEVIGGFKIWANDLASIPSLLRPINREISSLNNALDANKGFIDSTVQDFAGKSIEEQEKAFRQNLLIAQTSRDKVKQLQADNKRFTDEALKVMANGNQQVIDESGRVTTQLDVLARQGKLIREEYRKAVAELDADAKIASQTGSILRANRRNPILGTGAGKDIGDEDAARKKAEQERERARKLAEDLKAIAIELGAFNASQYQKDIAAAENKYAALLARAKGNADAEVEIERLKALEISQINLKYAKEAQDNFEKNEAKRITELNAKEREQRLRVLETAKEASKKFADFAVDSISSFDRTNLIEAQLKVRLAGFSKELAAQKAYLKEAERQEEESLRKRLAAKEITEAEFNALRKKSNQDFRDQDFEAELQHLQRLLDAISFWGNQVMGFLSTLYDSRRNSEENELARDRKANDKKKEQYKDQLDSKVISQQEYDRKVAALDKQQDEKEKQIKLKQFKRDQQLNIGRAIIATAQAVLQAYAQGGPIVGAILAAAVAAIGAIQIGIIAGQEPPEFGRGGRTKGPRHKSRHNGMPVTNPETGEVQAYLEGDEGILKRSAMLDTQRYTVTGTPSEITSRLNSMHGGVNWETGATLAPAWIDYTPKALNFKGITDTIGRVRMFENGGTFATSSSNSVASTAPAPATDPKMEALLLLNVSAIQELRQEIANGIMAWVSLTQLNDQQQRLDDMRDNSTFRPQP